MAKSIARHHAEWLSLVEVSGPFLSMPVLQRVFPQGLDALYRRVLPFAELVRDDTFDHPVVIPEGSVYVTAGTDRRTSGTHYTPRSLTEPIVQHTLDPLVYEGPADGAPKEQWKLKKPDEILDLKVCDMAMGSGAFLVQACRDLSEHLVESCEIHGVNIYELAGPEATPPVVSPPASNGAETSARQSEADDERLVLARRLVCDRYLVGMLAPKRKTLAPEEFDELGN